MQKPHNSVEWGYGTRPAGPWLIRICPRPVGQAPKRSKWLSYQPRDLTFYGILISETLNAGVKVRRVAERKCDTVTRLNPAGWRVSILLLPFARGLPSFETAL